MPRNALAAYGFPTAHRHRPTFGAVAAERRDLDLAKRAEMRKITLHRGQSLAWEAREAGYRIVSIFAGTGGGKTYFGPRYFYPILAGPDGLSKTYIFIEPTFRMLKRAMLPIVREFYDAFDLGTMHMGDMVYELRGGGVIIFASIDNPQSIQGIHPDGGIWADEIGLYPEEAWDVILQRSAFHQVPVLNTSTPYTLAWCEKRLAKPAERENQKDYWLLQYPSFWNPSYPEKQWRDLKRQWPKDKFNRLMRGLFTRIAGLVFDEFHEDRNLATIRPAPEIGERVLYFHNKLEGSRYVEVTRVWGAQDWGWSPDPGVQLLFAEDGYGRIYIFEEDYDTRIPVERGTAQGEDTWTNRARRRHERWGLDALYCDPSMPSNIEDMRSWSIPAEKADNRIEEGIDAVNTALRPLGGGMGAGLYIAQNACPNLVRTITSYTLAKSSQSEGYLKKPAPNQDDHAADAARYGVMGATSQGEPTIGLPPVIIGTHRRG